MSRILYWCWSSNLVVIVPPICHNLHILKQWLIFCHCSIYFNPQCNHSNDFRSHDIVYLQVLYCVWCHQCTTYKNISHKVLCCNSIYNYGNCICNECKWAVPLHIGLLSINTATALAKGTKPYIIWMKDECFKCITLHSA